MKFNFKKVASVFASVALVGATLGFASAATYPQPFEGSDYAIVVGANAANSDMSAAMDIGKNLAGVSTTTTTTRVEVGDESVNIGETAANELWLGSSIDITLDDYDLPNLLKTRTIRADGESIEYVQELSVGGHTINFTDLGRAENYANPESNEAKNEEPVLHVRQTSVEAWNLTLEFDDPFNALEVSEGNKLVIAGREWSVDPNLKAGDALTLFAASSTVNVEAGQSRELNLDGKRYTLTVHSVSEGGNTARVSIDAGNPQIVGPGEEIEAADGQIFYINKVEAWAHPVESGDVEIFVGSEKLEIRQGAVGGALSRVELNEETIRSVQGLVVRENNLTDINSIILSFTPADIRGVRDEYKYLEMGESITDPVLGTIALTFESSSQDFKDDSKEYFELRVVGDEKLEVTVSNDRGNEYVFDAYELNNDGDAILPLFLNNSANLTDSSEEKLIILEGRQGESRVLEIEDVYIDLIIPEDSELSMTDISTGERISVEVGGNFWNRRYYVCFEGNESASLKEQLAITNEVCTSPNKTADGNYASVLTNVTTNNDVVLQLNAGNVTIKEHNDGDSGTGDLLTFNMSIKDEGTNDAELRVHFIEGTTQGGTDDEGDYGYYLTRLGSYIETEEDDYSWARLWVPGDSVEYNVYVSSSVTTTEGGDDVPRESVFVVYDNEAAQMSGKDLIVVGGSCINSIAALLLDGRSLCGPDFTTATGVGAGEYLLQTFAYEGNVALLVAGYDASDTANAANALMSGDNAIEVATDVKYKGTTAANPERV